MDYVKAQYPAKFIQGLFELTDEQINAALSYIELNRDAVEVEYAQVVRENEELQAYYANQNRDRLISTAAKIKTGNEAAWKKLQTMRSQRELKV
jgi:5'-deoxynucleotidase YfbR-like HD superfamily hydrolase